MAKKSKHRKKAPTPILMPHVADQSGESAPALSEDALRAKETVDVLVRDLFGAAPEGLSGSMAEEAESAVLPSEDDVAPPAPRQEAKQPSSTAREAVEQAFAARFEAEAEEAEAKGEEPLPAAPQAEEDPEPEMTFKEHIESSNQDFQLLMDLGYEDELGNAIGFERILTHHERGMSGRLSTKRKTSEVGNAEFERQNEDVDFRRSYARKRTKWAVSLAISAVMLLLILLYEHPDVFGTLIGGPFDGEHYPVSYILLGLQLLLLDAVLCYKQLLDGFMHLLRFSPQDHSLFSLLLVSTFLYHILLLLVPISSMAPTLYLSPSALCISLICGVELLNCHREALAFDVISARKQKYALLPRISVGAADQSAKATLLSGTEADRLLYARPIGFVRNYFANTEKRLSHHRSFGAQIFLIVSVGAALGLYALASGESIEGVFRTAFSAMLFCVPVTSLLLAAVPLFFAAVLRLRERGAIVGEEPLALCGESASLVLPDTEIFSDMEHEHLRFSEDCDAHHTTVLLSALLEKLQSPLACDFGVDASSRIQPSALTVSLLESGGVCATLQEGQEKILFGTPAFLRANGQDVHVREEEDADLSRRVMCVAVNGRHAATFLVRYTLCADVERLFFQMARQELKVTVRTKDPCVRKEIFDMLMPRYARMLSVQTPALKEKELRVDRVDVSIVSLGSCKETARTYMTCRRARRVGLWGKILQGAISVSGALFAIVATHFGILASGMTVTLWLLAWCGVYAMLSYWGLRRSADEL